MPDLNRLALRAAVAGALTVLLSVAAAAAEPIEPTSVTVFAAASLTSALTEILPREAYPHVSLSFAGSSALARQIDAGAPADLFLSANRRWMDYLQQRGRIDSTSRIDLLANRLVIVAPAGDGFVAEASAGFDFAGAFDGRLTLGDPDHVPAGLYARQALERLGWWVSIRPRLAPAPDVRAALVYVERGECAAGVVYATDAALSAKVELVVEVPSNLHTPIRYPAAIVADRGTAAVRSVFRRLRSADADAVFQRQGFIVLDAPGGDN